MASRRVSLSSLSTQANDGELINVLINGFNSCLLYTSEAADDLVGVDLGGRRIIKKRFF